MIGFKPVSLYASLWSMHRSAEESLALARFDGRVAEGSSDGVAARIGVGVGDVGL